jgi:hypothetical protein
MRRTKKSPKSINRAKRNELGNPWSNLDHMLSWSSARAVSILNTHPNRAGPGNEESSFSVPSRFRPATKDRHLQRLDDKLLIDSFAHGPADDASGIQIQQYREIEPSCRRRDERNVANPNPIH